MQSARSVADLVYDLSVLDLLLWPTRCALLSTIYAILRLNAGADKSLGERLAASLHDSDFRVRLEGARRVGLLFLTWDDQQSLLTHVL